MKTMIIAAAAALSLSMGVAYADSEGGQVANTQFTEMPGVLAQAPVQNAPAVATAQNGQAVHAYVAKSSRGTWLFQPNQNGGGGNQRLNRAQTVKRGGRHHCRPFAFQPESFSSTQPRDTRGFFLPLAVGVGIHAPWAGLRTQLQNSAGLFPRSQRHARAVAILVEARRRRPMRAYVTAAGMALGLVGVWAALVPFVA